MMAILLYFGKLQDVVGHPRESYQLPSDIISTVSLRAHLDQKFDLNGALLEKTVRLAINGEIVSEPSPVSNSDEIAFMPPVGGG